MEDYFCIPKNIQSAKLYVEYLRKKFGGNIIISFSNDNYDLYESYPLIDFGKRFGIYIIPSIMFVSNDGIILVSFNPSNRSISLLEEIKEEKINRVVNILYGLSDKFSIHISPDQILEKLERSELTDIYLVSNDDIIDIINDSIYYNNRSKAEYLFNSVNMPRLFTPYTKLVKKLSDEKELYIANPEFFIEQNNHIENIKGFILNYKTININKIKDICLYHKLDIRFGSGRLI